MTIHPLTALLLADSSAALGWVYLGIFLACCIGYQAMLRNGMRARTVVTSLSDEQIVEVFAAKVGGMGWHLTDWYGTDPDGRLVAESSMLAGIRQQIGLTIRTDPRFPGQRVARVMVLRYSKKLFGGPTKAHTLRMRLTGFTTGIRRLDPTVAISVGADMPVTTNRASGRPATAGSTVGTTTSAVIPPRTITPVGAAAPIVVGMAPSPVEATSFQPVPAPVHGAAWVTSPVSAPLAASGAGWPPAATTMASCAGWSGPATSSTVASSPTGGGIKGSLAAGRTTR